MNPHSKQYPLPLSHEQRMTAEDFMITESNGAAFAWIDRWPEWPSHCLVIYGPKGAGKTHLVEIWRKRSGATSMMPHAIETMLKEKINLVIDNADTASGNNDAEENLFHAFNSVRELNGSMLLTASKAPSEWGIKLPDLRSRLVASTSVALLAPDDQLLTAMFIKQFRDRQLQVEAGVIDYMLPRIERSAEAIRNLVNALDEASLATGKGITITLARRFLGKEA